MTLEEAIKYYEETAKRNDENAAVYERIKNDNFNHPNEQTCNWAAKEHRKCAAEHRQLTKWLKQLKTVREIIRQHDADNMPEDYWYIDKIRDCIYFDHFDEVPLSDREAVEE